MTDKATNTDLVKACQDSIQLYGWQLLTAVELADKVSCHKQSREGQKWAWLIPREYFNHILSLWQGPDEADRQRAVEEAWQFVQRRTAECGRRRSLSEAQDVEDAASLAFLLILTNLDNVRENFFAFADNKIRDAITRVFRDRVPGERSSAGSDTSEEDFPIPDSSPTLSDATEANEVAAAVWRVLDHKLRTYPRAAVRQLKIIELRWRHEKRYEDIANELGVTVGNAHTMHSRGLTLLSQNNAMRELTEWL